MSATLVTEEWGLVGKGEDPETKLPMVLVARKKTDFAERVTTWKLVQHPNGWYNAAQMISTGVFRTYPEKKGVKLSDSRIDTILRDFATQGASSLV